MQSNKYIYELFVTILVDQEIPPMVISLQPFISFPNKCEKDLQKKKYMPITNCQCSVLANCHIYNGFIVLFIYM